MDRPGRGRVSGCRETSGFAREHQLGLLCRRRHLDHLAGGPRIGFPHRYFATPLGLSTSVFFSKSVGVSVVGHPASSPSSSTLKVGRPWGR